MKKSLVLLTVVVATLAFAGTTLALNCGLPPVCEELFVSKSAPWQGKWMSPKMGKISGPKCVTPKCGPCYTVPGSPYAIAPKLENIRVIKTVDVMRDLCVGKAKGSCPIGCGPCAPAIAWSGKWMTVEKCPAKPVAKKAAPKAKKVKK